MVDRGDDDVRGPCRRQDGSPLKLARGTFHVVSLTMHQKFKSLNMSRIPVQSWKRIAYVRLSKYSIGL